MIWAILASVSAIVLGIFGTLYPHKRKLLIALAVVAAIFAVALAINTHFQQKKFNKKIEKANAAILTEIANIDKPPELKRLKEIAQSQGVTIKQLFDRLEKGSPFDQGIKALAEKNYDGAIRLLEEEAKKGESDAAKSWFYAGVAAHSKGEYLKAADAYQRVVELDSKLYEAQYNWGVALGKLGQYEEAIEKFKEAVKYKSDDAAVWYSWGLALWKLGKPEDAIEKYKQAIKLRPDDADTWYNWGLALWKLGKNEDAIEKYKQAIKHKPDHAEN